MSYRYPYGNTEQMNLDWFLNQWEKFKADWAEAEAGIDGSLDSEIAKVEAAMSELYAARDAAAASATAARQSSLDAAAAQVAAGNSKTAAQAAETSARGSQQAAAESAQEAQASATGAENSALTATQAANTATQQAAGADAAKGAAEAAQQAAEAAQAAAAQSAGQAGQAATAAGDHADDAADSATLAQQAAQDMSDSVEQITTNKNDISELKESISDIDKSLNIDTSIIDVSDNQAGGIAYNFIAGNRYRVVLTTTGATQYQVGTVQAGNYVDQLTDVVSGNANLDITFRASGNANQFYVYLTPSSARYSAILYLIEDRFIDNNEYNEKWIQKSKKFDTIIRNGFTSESDMWGIVDGIISTDGLTLQQGGSAFHRMPLAFDDYIFSATFKILSAGTIVGIATEGSWKSKITIDQSATKAIVYTNYNDGQTLIEAASINLSNAINVNSFYRIELRRNGWDYQLKVINCANNIAICNYTFSNFKNVTTRSYSRFNGYFGVVCDAGSALCNDISVMINHKKSKCLIIGDSLTEGDQVTNDKRWGYLLKNNYFNGNAIVAGAGGDSTTAIKTRLQTYIDLGITFDVCIVLGGMNNRSAEGYTSYTTDMDAIYSMIINAFALPIIAVNPIPSEGADYIHQQRSYIVSKGWNTIRFDYAFSPSYSYNPEYFNSDGIHPNAAGNMVMYQAATTALNNLLF